VIEQIDIFIQIVLIDIVLAGDNAIVIGVTTSQFDNNCSNHGVNL
jgi:predicted tellurium resistance membrane protein TerC